MSLFQRILCTIGGGGAIYYSIVGEMTQQRIGIALGLILLTLSNLKEIKNHE